jgi:hypothetical protein
MFDSGSSWGSTCEVKDIADAGHAGYSRHAAGRGLCSHIKPAHDVTLAAWREAARGKNRAILGAVRTGSRLLTVAADTVAAWLIRP